MGDIVVREGDVKLLKTGFRGGDEAEVHVRACCLAQHDAAEGLVRVLSASRSDMMRYTQQGV